MVGAEPGRAIEVVLVEGRAVVRAGLRRVVEAEADLAVAGQAATIEQAAVLDTRPDVVVTDLDVPDKRYDDFFRVVRKHFDAAPVLVFTRVEQPADVRAVLAAGADGYVLETATTGELVDGIRTVAHGQGYLQPALGAELARLHVDLEARRTLTSTEEEVLRLLAIGHTNREISEMCNLSLRTVESVRAHIQRKVGRRGRVEIMEYAREVGVL